MGTVRRLASRGALLLALAPPFAGISAAQRGDVERKTYEDASGGYRLKLPKGAVIVPVSPDERRNGLALRADDGGRLFRIVTVDSDDELTGWVKRVASELRDMFDPRASGDLDLSDRPEV